MASICLQVSIIISRQHAYINSSSGFGQEQLCLFVMTQTNNPISLPADMKVSLFWILSVLFGLRGAVHVFAAVWIIAFWISSSDKQTQLFRCSYARSITQPRVEASGLLAGCKWHLQHDCSWVLKPILLPDAPAAPRDIEVQARGGQVPELHLYLPSSHCDNEEQGSVTEEMRYEFCICIIFKRLSRHICGFRPSF